MMLIVFLGSESQRYRKTAKNPLAFLGLQGQ